MFTDSRFPVKQKHKNEALPRRLRTMFVRITTAQHCAAYYHKKEKYVKVKLYKEYTKRVIRTQI